MKEAQIRVAASFVTKAKQRLDDNPWLEDAACILPPNRMPSTWMYPEATSSIRGQHLSPAERRMLKLCFKCPVRAECLWLGLEEPWGIWGGTLPEDRSALRTGQKEAIVAKLWSASLDRARREGLIGKEVA